MNESMRMPEYTLCTPPNVTSAIGYIQVRTPNAADMDSFLAKAGCGAPIGEPVLRDLFGIDQGLVIRWDSTTLDLFPHGGVAIIRRLTSTLEELGLVRSESTRYPEAADEMEQRMLGVLAAAASPLAVGLLLDQPRRWSAKDTSDLADADVLNRLVRPAMVAAIGPPNIGKSTLLNAMAGRSVAIVADMPGTTRDHVGALLDLGGVVVRYLDTPGRLVGASGIDQEAIALADRAVASADLVLLCGDPSAPPPLLGESMAGRHMIRVCLRSDLGVPSWEPSVSVCAHSGAGIGELVTAIKEELVPESAISDPRPWRFWNESENTGG